jgi:hypothetical protein
LLALIYLAIRRMFALILLRCRSREFKELEIVVLHHELAILRRQVGRPALRPADRVFLTAASRLVPRQRWSSFFVTPDTLLRWHRQLVARRWTYPRGRPGRPRIGVELRELVLRLARENLRWGYQRIAGELGLLGRSVSATTVRKVLREAGLGPAGKRAGPSWREFIRGQAQNMLACDFFTCRHRLLEASLRALLHRARNSPGAPGRRDRESERTVDRAAGAQLRAPTPAPCLATGWANPQTLRQLHKHSFHRISAFAPCPTGPVAAAS